MSTSANVLYFDIYKGNEFIKTHRQNLLCKSKKADLFSYQPLENYCVQVRFPDEDEVIHISEKMPLADFLNGQEYELRHQ